MDQPQPHPAAHRGQEAPALSLTGFKGLVTVNTFRAPNGRWVSGFIGTVSIIHSEDLVPGKTFKGSDNWFARIEGASGLTVNIPGCKVESVVTFPEATVASLGIDTHEFYEVP